MHPRAGHAVRSVALGVDTLEAIKALANLERLFAPRKASRRAVGRLSIAFIGLVALHSRNQPPC